MQDTFNRRRDRTKEGMNTVLKGDNYENECFILIKRLLDNSDLGLLPNNCKVYQKPKYYSKDREDYITFDISIEVWLKDATKYSMLVLIECKDYTTKKAPIDDIEEFHDKIKQVAGSKGIFISTKAHSDESTFYKYARSKGIMLIESNTNITFNIILHKTNRYKQIQEEQQFNDIAYIDYDDPFIKEYVHRKWERKIETGVINAFVYNINAQMLTKENIIPKLSRRTIDTITTELLNIYNPDIFRFFKSINLDDFKEYLFNVFGLQVIHTTNLGIDGQGRKILSQCLFVSKRIEIDLSIVNSNRYSFILGHELGHYFLHNKLTLSQFSYERFDDVEYDYSIAKYKLDSPRSWIEWQANVFSSCLIMPAECILARMRIIQDRIGLRPGRRLFVDQQKCNQDDFYKVTGELSDFFNTTKSSVIYRLEALEMIKFDHRRSTKTLGQLLYEMYPSLFD